MPIVTFPFKGKVGMGMGLLLPRSGLVKRVMRCDAKKSVLLSPDSAMQKAVNCRFQDHLRHVRHLAAGSGRQQHPSTPRGICGPESEPR